MTLSEDITRAEMNTLSSLRAERYMSWAEKARALEDRIVEIETGKTPPPPVFEWTNDMARAMGILAKIAHPVLTGLLDDLSELVERSQNRPPFGQADGSISERQWTALRDICDALLSASAAAKTLHDGDGASMSLGGAK